MRLSPLTIALLLIVILHAVFPSAAGAQLSARGRQPILADKFTVLSSVSTIPERVLRSLREMTKSEGVLLAEPGADFQATDAIVNADLPGRRLVFAGVSKRYCLIHYEKGGIAHTYYVVLFRIGNDEATFEWGGRSDRAFKDFGELRKAISEDRLRENPDGWW